MKEKPGLHHLALLSIISKYAFIISIPTWIYMDVFTIIKTSNESPPHLYGYLILDGFLTSLQNIIAFTVLSLVSPLTYSVANSSKRIAVIIVSLITMKNPITFTNLFGMCTAVTGVLLYNRAKHEQNVIKHSLPVYSKMNGSINGSVNGSINGSINGSTVNGNALLNNGLMMNGHKSYGPTYVRYY